MRFHKILTVIDPTNDRQRALERACVLAQAQDAVVHAYLCCCSNQATDDYAALRGVELARHTTWLLDLLAPHIARGLSIEHEVEWHEDWRARIAPAATRVGADLIVKSSYRRMPVRRRLLKTSDWLVLREAGCPVLLVKRDEAPPYSCALAAFGSTELDAPGDAAVLALARLLGGDTAMLHAVAACNAEHRHAAGATLASRTGLPASNSHTLVARIEDAVVDCAELLGAELVVMAASAPGGPRGMPRAERALDRLDTDLLVVTAHQ